MNDNFEILVKRISKLSDLEFGIIVNPSDYIIGFYEYSYNDKSMFITIRHNTSELMKNNILKIMDLNFGIDSMNIFKEEINLDYRNIKIEKHDDRYVIMINGYYIGVVYKGELVIYSQIKYLESIIIDEINKNNIPFNKRRENIW